MFRKALTFDDLLLVPQYSTIESIDDEIDTSTKIGNWELEIPIISAAMDTVTGIRMQKTMRVNGGLGIHHRYVQNYNDLIDISVQGPIAVSPSMGGDFFKDLYQHYNDWQRPITRTVVIDVAHGYRKKVIDLAKFCKKYFFEVWSGNVCTAEAAKRYIDLGIGIIKCGIGPGSSCITRENTGCGYPQASAIYNVKNGLINGKMHQGFGVNISVIADGGIKNSGDIVKALALGADAVILGGLLAGADEAPGDILVGKDGKRYKEYRGMASLSALKQNNKTVRVEGVSGMVPYKGPVEDVINSLMSGVKLGMAYVGARSIKELQEKAEFVEITSAGQYEGQARI
jgi:IMP dehydrogenase